jgi:putative Ca2+/H+ antiporter (TMEM165/GDT1 family)
VHQPLSLRQRISGYIPKVFLQALTLTFLAEWGDRSQLATIILAAREVCRRGVFLLKLWIDLIKFIFLQDIFGVMLGGVLGHSLCTGLAVLGGRMIAQKISVKTGNLNNKFLRSINSIKKHC